MNFKFSLRLTCDATCCSFGYPQSPFACRSGSNSHLENDFSSNSPKVMNILGKMFFCPRRKVFVGDYEVDLIV